MHVSPPIRKYFCVRPWLPRPDETMRTDQLNFYWLFEQIICMTLLTAIVVSCKSISCSSLLTSVLAQP